MSVYHRPVSACRMSAGVGVWRPFPLGVPNMRLQSNERSILAAFSDSKQAEQAAAELKESGVEAIRVDELRQEPGEPTDGLHELITGAGIEHGEGRDVVEQPGCGRPEGG